MTDLDRSARWGIVDPPGSVPLSLTQPPALPRVTSGVPGFDYLTLGGLPEGRVTVLAGPAGSAKTVMAAQFLADGVRAGGAGVFVTMEEPAADLRRNLATLGMDVPAWEAAEAWAFVDASPLYDGASGAVSPPSVATLLAQIGREVDRTGAERVVLDSVGTALDGSEPDHRQRLHVLLSSLRRMGLTVLVTVETPQDDAARLGANGAALFVADAVVVLRNTLEDERRRRTIEVLKMRGAVHRRGQYPFTVLPGTGAVVLPAAGMSLTHRSTQTRISSGNEALDALCGGGFFRDSIVLASGATGTGKTLMVTEFVDAGVQADDRAMLFAFEESHDQLMRNALGWGRDFGRMERAGLLRIEATYPEVASLEDHLVEIKAQIDRHKPDRIAIDSLSALERIASERAFREFVIGLTAFVKSRQVAALFTASTSSLLGGSSITETHISTLTDSIILLRYVEVFGTVRRGLAVLKMRGSVHDTNIHEFVIEASGMRLREPFRQVGGILSGNLVTLVPQGQADSPES